MTIIENTLGAASIGFNVACCLFGVLTTQVFIYFKRYCLDRPIYKFLVCCCHCLFCIASEYLIKGLVTLVNFSLYQDFVLTYHKDAGVIRSSTYWIFNILLQHNVRFLRILYVVVLVAEYVLQTLWPLGGSLRRQPCLVSYIISPS